MSDTSYAEMGRSIGRDFVERQLYGHESVDLGEQYCNMRAEYRLFRTGTNTGQVEVRVVSAKSGEQKGKRAVISLDDYAGRPKASRDKPEARWAFALCGVKS